MLFCAVCNSLFDLCPSPPPLLSPLGPRAPGWFRLCYSSRWSRYVFSIGQDYKLARNLKGVSRDMCEERVLKAAMCFAVLSEDFISWFECWNLIWKKNKAYQLRWHFHFSKSCTPANFNQRTASEKINFHIDILAALLRSMYYSIAEFLSQWSHVMFMCHKFWKWENGKIISLCIQKWQVEILDCHFIYSLNVRITLTHNLSVAL